MHILFSFGLLFAVCCLLFLRVLYYFIHVLPNVLSISRSQSQHEVTYVCTQYTVMYKVRLTVHVCFEWNMWHVACGMALPATLPVSTLSSALVGRLVLVYTRILHLNTKTLKQTMLLFFTISFPFWHGRECLFVHVEQFLKPVCVQMYL